MLPKLREQGLTCSHASRIQEEELAQEPVSCQGWAEQ